MTQPADDWDDWDEDFFSPAHSPLPGPTGPIGYVTGTLEIRAPDGTLKGVLHLDGATDLTEPELREQLGLTSPET